MTNGRKKLLGLIAGLAVLAAVGGGAAYATGVVDDDERPITGSALERASAAALAHTGGGRVTETEVDDEDSKYEVEVTLADGRQIDVQLDADFNVVGEKVDDEGEDGDDDGKE